MKKCLLFVCCSLFFVYAENLTISPNETKVINGRIFEGSSGDFIIKNNGILILENCVFRKNNLGSKNDEAIFSDEKVIAPIVNYGKLSLVNCKFTDNYSWNTALSSNFEAKAAAGAVVNFGDLELADNNIFEKNS